MKACCKCKASKLLSEFSKNCTQCKDCWRRYYQGHREKIIKKVKAYQQSIKGKAVNLAATQKYRQTEKGKSTRRDGARKYRLRHPEKQKAHDIINRAIVIGRLKRSVFCEKCGLPAKTQGHHSDYNKPADVDWLCNSCHSLISIIN